MIRRILSRRHKKAVEPAKLIAGLGNPGKAYAKNRHNVGFQLLDRVAAKYELSFDRIESQALLAHGGLAGERVILLKPLTYMNQSGKAVRPAVRRYDIPIAHMLIVHDDLDLPLGKVRLREHGGAGGHKGMESVISFLKTQDIARLRIGIGRPKRGSPDEYVLQDFSLEERIIMEGTFEKAVAALECFLREGITVAMNEYN
jgi:PTH1 family peptidyl-tRNA hydrolase